MIFPNPIEIKSLSQARRVKRKFNAIITIEDPAYKKGLRFHNLPHPDQLVMCFEDVDKAWDTVALPHRIHVETALEFAREHADGSLLIHCHAGVARSTAIALAIIADRLGYGKEEEAVESLLHIRPESVPNIVLLDIADEALGRNGLLKKAWMDVEAGNIDYAKYRDLKVSMFEKHPEFYASAPADITMGMWRYRPNSLVKERIHQEQIPELR